MKLRIITNKLELNHPFTIARWTYTHTASIVVELTHKGIKGYGEATHNPYYPNTEIDYLKSRLLDLQYKVEEQSIIKPELFWGLFSEELEDCPFALCALDEAYHDLYTKLQELPLYQYWNLTPNKNLLHCYTLSMDDIDVMIKRMSEKPWDIYKIKLGMDNDIDVVEALRQHTDSTFWVDANCAWNVGDTIRKSKELNKLGVTLIEQPLPDDQWLEMEEVFHKSSIPLIADESCKKINDIIKCKGKFHGINIKVMKCGGLTPALKMIQEANKHQLKTMVGCMAESTVGISAIAHLTPLIDYADMDGQHFIKNDPASGVMVQSGGIVFSDIQGTGVVMPQE